MNAMLISSGLPQNMWGEAILTSNYLLNKVPRKKEEKTPYELWKGRAPSYQYLRVWGCLAKVVVPTPKRLKQVQRLLIAFLLDMLKTVMLIGFLCMIQKFQIYTKTR